MYSQEFLGGSVVRTPRFHWCSQKKKSARTFRLRLNFAFFFSLKICKHDFPFTVKTFELDGTVHSVMFLWSRNSTDETQAL